MSALQNRVTLIGRIGADPEYKKVGESQNVSLAHCSLATNEGKYDKNGEWKANTQWHQLVAWGKVANQIASTIKKGKEVMIVGKILNKTYEKEGEKRYYTEIEINELILLANKRKDDYSEKLSNDIKQ